MGTNSGTGIYCPLCKSIQICRMRTEYDSFSKGNRYETEYPEIQYFMRPRECMKCGHDFETYEIASGFILELVKLRELVEQMKLTINKYQD